ncbi:MAG: ABC transporter permease [Streptosporangiales bacterium]
MARIVGRRLLIGLIVLFAVSVLVFAASLVLPGDAARALIGRDASPERLVALRAQLHVNQSLPVRYASWLGDLFTGELGDSLATGRPVAALIGERAANSAVLVALSAVVATPVAILLGTVTAWRRGGVIDRASSAARPVAAAVPQFVVGILAILLFSTAVLHWFPAATPTGVSGSVWGHPAALVLPAVTLAIGVLPHTVQRMRTAVAGVAGSAFVQQARLRGVPERTVLRRYVAPNAIGAVAQAAALQLAWLTGGLVIVEYLFAYPGIGRGLVDAVASRDLPTLQALVLVIAAAYLVLHALADVLRALTSPEMRTAR